MHVGPVSYKASGAGLSWSPVVGPIEATWQRGSARRSKSASRFAYPARIGRPVFSSNWIERDVAVTPRSD